MGITMVRNTERGACCRLKHFPGWAGDTHEHGLIEKAEGSEVGGTGERPALGLQGPHPTDGDQDVGEDQDDWRDCGEQ